MGSFGLSGIFGVEGFGEFCRYVEQNPVRAGLVMGGRGSPADEGVRPTEDSASSREEWWDVEYVS
jgi:hypothetical protein